MTSALLHLRQRSLLRANLLVLGSCIATLPLSHFPHLQPSPLLVLPALVALAGTADTVRCICRRWCIFHGAVLVCLYMDLMALTMIFFLLIYPYLPPITARAL